MNNADISLKRVPYPENESEFKEMIANAYLAGTELMVDFYLEHR